MAQVQIYLTKHLLTTIDKFRQNQQFPPSRSALIAKAIDEYFKIHCGLPYIFSKKTEGDKNDKI